MQGGGKHIGEDPAPEGLDYKRPSTCTLGVITINKIFKKKELQLVLVLWGVSKVGE